MIESVAFTSLLMAHQLGATMAKLGRDAVSLSALPMKFKAVADYLKVKPETKDPATRRRVAKRKAR